MADFNRNNRGGGRSFDRPRRDFGGGRGGDRSDRQMHQTTCSNCGKTCEVPFKPTGSKPVYCSDCFRAMGPQDSGRGERRDNRMSFDRNDRPVRNEQSQYKDQFEALNTKLDKILKILTPSLQENVIVDKEIEPESQEVELKLSEEVVTPVKKKRVPKKANTEEIKTSSE